MFDYTSLNVKILQIMPVYEKKTLKISIAKVDILCIRNSDARSKLINILATKKFFPIN